MNLIELGRIFKRGLLPKGMNHIYRGTPFYHYKMGDGTSQYAEIRYNYIQDDLYFEPITLFEVLIECSVKVPIGNNYSEVIQYLDLPNDIKISKGKEYDLALYELFS